MGVSFVKRAWWIGPVTGWWSSGWVDCSLVAAMVLGGLRRCEVLGLRLEELHLADDWLAAQYRKAAEVIDAQVFAGQLTGPGRRG
jgi:hypothetical protein